MSSFKQIYNFAIILICVLLITSTQQWAYNDTGCRTPDSGVGSCVPMDTCEHIQDFLKYSPESKEMLSGYYCSVENNSFKVCCPYEPIISTNVTFQTRVNVEPPDVTNHKNVHLLPVECGFQIGGDRISGGNQTALSEFPWMALLSYQSGSRRDFRCGGTIINNRYILTAAHCLTNLSDQKLIGVRVGEHNITSVLDCEEEINDVDYCAPPFQDLAISEVIPHPLFNSTSYAADIGLIRLATNINLTVENALPICLPLGDGLRNKSFSDAILTVTGWGATETGGRMEVLQKVSLPAVLEETCRKAYAKYPVAIDGSKICAGGRRTDACSGDSGGPLQMSIEHQGEVKYYQFGIVSYGPLLCARQEGIPSVYSRIDFYMDWILDNMKP